MKSIYKYPLKVRDVQYLDLPKGAEILSMAVQFEENIVIYALVDRDEKETEPREVRVYGTGFVVDEDINELKFLGTARLFEGAFMYHVFIK